MSSLFAEEMAAAAPGPRLYRSRRPERTVLYRPLADSFERFLGVYEERFEPTRGYLRGSVERAVHRYLDCRIFAQGAARAHCAECEHDVLIAFSCKLRCLCPSCHQKRKLLWHPHLQVVLTDGGWLPDGTFRHLLAFDSSAVEKLFRAEVLRLLVARGKIPEEIVENLLTWRHSGFSVHAGAPVEEGSEAVRLGPYGIRYGIRCPLVTARAGTGA